MKKLILLSLAIFTLFASASAQYGFATVSPLQQGDTLVNTDTAFRVIQVTTGITSASFQVNANVTSGTLAGAIFVYGSNDGRNYVQVATTAWAATPAGWLGSVFGMANGYNHMAQVTLTSVPYQYYLLAANSSGTSVAPVQFLWTLRKFYPY